MLGGAGFLPSTVGLQLLSGNLKICMEVSGCLKLQPIIEIYKWPFEGFGYRFQAIYCQTQQIW